MVEQTEKPKYNQAQFELLKKCSDNRNMSDWNNYRLSNLREPINLEGAPLNYLFLSGGNFKAANFKKAWFMEADLSSPKEREKHNTTFEGADLSGACLNSANLEGAEFENSILTGARICNANLKNAFFHKSHLESAEFYYSIVDGQTYIVRCSFNEYTDFKGVGLDSARIEPGLKSGLKNNIRRIHWQKWIALEQEKGSRSRVTAMLVRWFWRLSDYGSSTGGIVKWFFYLAGGFGLLYWIFAMVPGDHSIVANLRQVDGVSFSALHTLARSLYFSIVTMTTLGFGDMHAAKTEGWAGWLGYLFLSVQVIIGYVILGAMVTRLGILFTSEAPAAEPTPIAEADEGTDSSGMEDHIADDRRRSAVDVR